jgi:leucyl aminopeptidase
MMISIRLGNLSGTSPAVVAIPVLQSGAGDVTPAAPLSGEVAVETGIFLADSGQAGKAGSAGYLPRPTRTPGKVFLCGAGTGDEQGWRMAGAALARIARREPEFTVLLPEDLADSALRGLAEGIWLGDYRYRLRAEKPDEERRIESVHLAVPSTPQREEILRAAGIVSGNTNFARDLTNTPSLIKTPAWFAEQVRLRQADGLTITVREEAQLIEEGFGGILAVGQGSVNGPRFLELTWSPPGATEHIVLVGKGITYDTGGIDIKPAEYMQLMRKDMGGAAAVCAATIAAAQLQLGVRVTALAPLAENMVSGSSWRSGDVVRHYGGLTSEIHNTDAEGRVVLADALAYATAHLEPDLIIDLATLTGAARVALGTKIAALFYGDEELGLSLETASAEAGEHVWRLPLADEYLKDVFAELGDFNNAAGNPGAITAALYLREFAGPLRDRWAHIDMSAPAWASQDDGELSKGATGWGVRTLVRFLTSRTR